MLFSEISRKQAFSTHLGISLCIFFILSYLVLFEWYPSYYLQIDGGYRGLATIFFVDVVLGPGLTLLVFKQGKKGLKFDLTMIVLFQVIALSWGLNSVYTSRPALTVFYDGRFACVPDEEVKAGVVENLGGRETGEPLLAFLRRPDTYDGYLEFSMEPYREHSSEIYYYSERFENINDSSLNRIKTYHLDVDAAILKNKESEDRYQKVWASYKENNPAKENIIFIPLACRYKQGMAVFDTELGKIVDYVDVFANRAKSTIELTVSKEAVESPIDKSVNEITDGLVR